MITYEHTQIGVLMIAVMAAVTLLYGFIWVGAGFDMVILAVMSGVLVILASFTTLKVTIDERYVRLMFGYGLFRAKFPLDAIASVKAVRNHWYYGWGIKWWPSMWIYSVSGFDAVEITTKNGKVYRIGTDEPKELEAAVRGGMHV